jgi:hypothetical protein
MSDSVAMVIATISVKTAASLDQQNRHTKKMSVASNDALVLMAALDGNNAKLLIGF